MESINREQHPEIFEGINEYLSRFMGFFETFTIQQMIGRHMIDAASSADDKQQRLPPTRQGPLRLAIDSVGGSVQWSQIGHPAKPTRTFTKST